MDGLYKNFAITLTKISFSEQGQSIDAPSSGTALPVNIVLNSGSVFTYLPSAVANDIFRGLQVAGTATRDGVTTAFADCNAATSGITIDFFFGSVKISIPVGGILFDFNVYKQTDKDGNQVCGLKIRPTDDSNYVLGLSFFEVAYIVFDLTNNQISLAPAKKGATDSNVIEVGQSPDTNGGETTNNGGGGPNLDGLTLVDPKDYPSLTDGTFIPYEDYVQATAGDQSVGGDSKGSFFEIDPKDFSKINPADLITYDQFIASLGGSTAPNQTPANAGNTNDPTPSGNGDGQVTPGSGDQGTAGTPGIPTAGQVIDPGTASLVGTTSTTVLGGDSQDGVVIDPTTGLPVDQSSIVGAENPFDDSLSDPLGGGDLFKRIPAPAAQRKRRSFY